MNEWQDNNTDCSTVSLVSIIVSYTFPCKYRKYLFWKWWMLLSFALPSQILKAQHAVSYPDWSYYWLHKCSEGCGLCMGAQRKALSYDHSIPWNKYALSPVLVAYVVPLLCIQVIYDQATSLELEVQGFLLKYFTYIHAFQPVIPVTQQLALFIDLWYDNHILDTVNIAKPKKIWWWFGFFFF